MTDNKQIRPARINKYLILSIVAVAFIEIAYVAYLIARSYLF